MTQTPGITPTQSAEDTRDEVTYPAWLEDGSAYEPEHLGWNPASERHETGGDEIEYSDESEPITWVREGPLPGHD